MRSALQTLVAYFQTHFVARWILASFLGWPLGLYLGSLTLSLLGGVLGLILGGALAGAVVGAAQRLAFRQQVAWSGRRWIGFSALGGALGALPAALAGVSLLAGWGLGWFIVGGLFGGVFGAVQAVVLNEHFRDYGWWIGANGLGGALCGLFSLAANPFGLPVFCTLGPALFGAVTGWMLARLLREAEL